MYTKLPNLVIGFHGCDSSTADKVFSGETTLSKSKNAYDWFGHGVYFWENNLTRAQQWAEEKFGKHATSKPAVIGAVLDLGCCLNLTDSESIGIIESQYKIYKKQTELQAPQWLPIKTAQPMTTCFYVF